MRWPRLRRRREAAPLARVMAAELGMIVQSGMRVDKDFVGTALIISRTLARREAYWRRLAKEEEDRDAGRDRTRDRVRGAVQRAD